MKLRYLIDENLSPRLKSAIQRLEPFVDVLRVGDQGAPSFGTLDPDVLVYLTATQRLLVTDNRKSMPKHLADHAVAGFQHSEAEEWIDRTEWLRF
ncbi:MAG: DUF5615 family PIN-like protein [Roseiflexaceae bacterium]|nr:DUF5615 family PIN-like protein [Roseiflexaceae bacterium]